MTKQSGISCGERIWNRQHQHGKAQGIDRIRLLSDTDPEQIQNGHHAGSHPQMGQNR